MLLLFSACGVHRSHTLSSSDSLRVEIIERRVEVHDTITLHIPIEIERVKILQDSSRLINSYSSSVAIVCPDGALYHTLETIPQSMKVPILSQVEVRDSVVYRERVVTNVVEVERELSRWQQIEISGFYILLFIVVIALLLRGLF